MVYLDSSAIVKLVLPELESEPLRDFLREDSLRVSSELVLVEVLRAVKRGSPGTAAIDRARSVLDRFHLLRLGPGLLEAAASVKPATVRALDAIHLASALSLEGMTAFVCYDRRLNQAAVNAGLTVRSPGEDP